MLLNRGTMKQQKEIPVKKVIGAIIILVGILSLVAQSGLLPASIFLESKEIIASPGQQVMLRYNYVNDGLTQERFVAEIVHNELGIVARQSFPLSPKTIFTGILKFNAPIVKGTYTYTLSVTGSSAESEQFKVVVK